MWHWQHKNIHKRHLLWAKLFGICFFCHLVFLFLIFVMYRDYSYTIALSLRNKLDCDRPIIFIPHGISVKTMSASDKSIMQKDNTVTKSFISTSIAPVIPASTTIAKNSTTITTTSAKKIENQQIKKQPAKIEKKAEPVVKKTISDETSKIVPSTAKFIKKTPSTDAPAAINQPQPLKTQQASEIPVISENAQICHDYRQAESLRRAIHLQKELVKKWQAPLGVPADCSCEISFFVNKKGNLQNVSIIKSSRVMMYDISARQALYSMIMPQWTYGKQLTVNFTQ